MAHRFVVGEAPAEPYNRYDEKTALERSGFGRALKTEGVWQNTFESNISLCQTAGFKALDFGVYIVKENFHFQQSLINAIFFKIKVGYIYFYSDSN